MLIARLSTGSPLVRTLVARRSLFTPTSSLSSVHSTRADQMPPANTPEWHDWRMNVPSSTPLDSPMLRNQGKLPRLPVVPLDETLARLKRSCEPLAKDQKELSEVEKKIEAFAKQGGVGRKLQDLLQKKREEKGMRNWLAKDWDEQAYMAYRDSVIINVSYYFGFDRLPQAPPSTPNPPAADPAYVAASIAKTALEFRRLIATGLLEPELVGRNKEDGELCMESYKWAFNACRVPASPSDYAVKTSETDPAAQHFVVVKRNKFYSVPIVDAAGQEVSVEGFRKAIQEVIEQAEKEGEAAPAVGVLTGINRDRWAEAHAHLSTNPTNVEALRSIHQSAFVICLDEAEPSSKTSEENIDFSWRLWTGGHEAGNRWWDKPLQWMVYRNGEAGFVGEHSCMDGTPTARLNDFLTKRLLTNEPFPHSSSSTSSVPSASPLPFALDSTALSHIEKARTEHRKHIEPYALHYLSYERYGKEGIKKMKASPDGWVQMLFQIAYYLTFKKPCGTYEAAQTRRYQLGRTETVRILTPESLAFVKSLVDSPSSTSAAEKVSLFRAALAQHGKDMKLASAGMGIDRHLFGLKMLAATQLGEQEKKEIMEGDGLFADPLVKESGTWRMSTSQIYIRHSPAYGWGPVVGGGLGLPYMIHPESLQLTVSCQKTVPGDVYIRNFAKAADLLMDLFEQAERDGQGQVKA
ncbi:hypothetical protein JCM10295v2_005984 [Rhodotorula toruloides]